MVGIVSEADLLKASPSEATSLSIYEVAYLLSKLTIDRIMTRKVITVTEDTPLEEAARIMADNKFSGLPVMRGKALVGMITETTLFRIFLELLGARRAGIRVTVSMPDIPGRLAALTKSLHDLGANIIALGTFMGESPSEGLVTFKVEGVEADALKKAIRPLVDKIIDIRTTKPV
jgi:acetoin utilization protein AcuB